MENTTTTTRKPTTTIEEQARTIGILATSGKDYGSELMHLCTRLTFGRLAKILAHDDNRATLKLWRDAGNLNRIETALQELDKLYSLEYDSNGNGETVCSDSERESKIIELLRDTASGEGKDLVQTACLCAVSIINHARELNTLDENVLLTPISVVDKRTLKSANRKYIPKSPIQLISGEISRAFYAMSHSPTPINYEERTPIKYTDTATGEELEQRVYKPLNYVSDTTEQMKRIYTLMRTSGLTPSEVRYITRHCINGETIPEIARAESKTEKGIESVILTGKKKLAQNPTLRKLARVEEDQIINPTNTPKVDCVYLVTDITAKSLTPTEYPSISAVALALEVSRTAIQKVLKAVDNDLDNKPRLLKARYQIERKYTD